MGGVRMLASVCGFVGFIIGGLFSYSSNPGEHNFGRTMAVAGAIIIAGLLIGLAISGKGRVMK